jgi:hypothetical protein
VIDVMFLLNGESELTHLQLALQVMDKCTQQLDEDHVKETERGKLLKARALFGMCVLSEPQDLNQETLLKAAG